MAEYRSGRPDEAIEWLYTAMQGHIVCRMQARGYFALALHEVGRAEESLEQLHKAIEELAPHEGESKALTPAQMVYIEAVIGEARATIEERSADPPKGDSPNP